MMKKTSDANFKSGTPAIQSTTAYDMALKTQQSDNIPITTGSAQIDSLLNGGIPIGDVTEVCGMSGTGKTQV